MKKMLVGVSDAFAWQDIHERRNPNHRSWSINTRNMPKRVDEILEGGSLYWVCGGRTVLRQTILNIEAITEGTRSTRITLDGVIHRVEAKPYRAFQGWRYLEPADAPLDIIVSNVDLEMPSQMRSDLSMLGLI